MSEYKKAEDTADAILERDGKVLMIRRGHDPFEGKLAFPGGFVDFGEQVEVAVVREAMEELHIKATPKAILGVYSGEARDPRWPTVTTVFICDFEGEPEAGDDAASFEWVDLASVDTETFAFDHGTILRHYIEWKKHPQTFWSSK